MEYTAVFAAEGIRNCEPAFAYRDGELPETLSQSIPKQFKDLPVVTNKNTPETYLLGVAGAHIAKFDMGSVAVSGILGINVSNSDPDFESPGSGNWLKTKEKKRIVGKILNKSTSFDANGECNSYTIQLMPWVSELTIDTKSVHELLKEATRKTIKEALNAIRKDETGPPLTADLLTEKLAKPLQKIMTTHVGMLIEKSLLGN